jgi:hypothetical protein
LFPPEKNRKVQHRHGKRLYKSRYETENALGLLKDWRRIATGYYRCAHTIFEDLHRCGLHLLASVMSLEPDHRSALET